MDLGPPVVINGAGEARIQAIMNCNRFCLVARPSRSSIRIRTMIVTVPTDPVIRFGTGASAPICSCERVFSLPAAQVPDTHRCITSVAPNAAIANQASITAPVPTSSIASSREIPAIRLTTARGTSPGLRRRNSDSA